MTTRRLLEVECNEEDELVVHFRPRLFKVFPDESVRHWRRANLELLLAAKSILDGVIKGMTPSDSDEQGRRGRRRQRVEVKEEESG